MKHLFIQSNACEVVTRDHRVRIERAGYFLGITRPASSRAGYELRVLGGLVPDTMLHVPLDVGEDLCVTFLYKEVVQFTFMMDVPESSAERLEFESRLLRRNSALRSV